MRRPVLGEKPSRTEKESTRECITKKHDPNVFLNTNTSNYEWRETKKNKKEKQKTYTYRIYTPVQQEEKPKPHLDSSFRVLQLKRIQATKIMFDS